MGRLMYDSTTAVDFDDRTLAHLQIVIGAKLRRGESFPFSWTIHATPHDEARNSLWLAPDIPLHFTYYGSRRPVINIAWILQLSALSNSSAGLRLIPEPPIDAEEPDRSSTEG